MNPKNQWHRKEIGTVFFKGAYVVTSTFLDGKMTKRENIVAFYSMRYIAGTCMRSKAKGLEPAPGLIFLVLAGLYDGKNAYNLQK